jgi:hypothetical protein
MAEVGETTRDMRTRGQLNPAERDLDPHIRETAVQTTGLRHRRAGLAILLGAPATGLAAAYLAEGQVFHQQNAQIFAFLALVATIAIGVTYLASGLSESRGRHGRALHRQILAEQQKFRVEHAEDRERLDLVIGLVSALPGRLDALAGRLDALERAIDKVPAYGDGVIHGMTLRNDAMGPESR